MDGTSDGCPALIETEDPEVENPCEAHPGEIGDEQPRGGRSHALERPDGGQDRHPEEPNDEESSGRRSETEEDDRPGDVESELPAERPQGDPTGTAPSVANDEVGPRSHEGEQQGPHGGEDPIGGREGGLRQVGVPGPTRPGGDERGCRTDDLGGENGDEDSRQVFTGQQSRTARIRGHDGPDGYHPLPGCAGVGPGRDPRADVGFNRTPSVDWTVRNCFTPR